MSDQVFLALIGFASGIGSVLLSEAFKSWALRNAQSAQERRDLRADDRAEIATLRAEFNALKREHDVLVTERAELRAEILILKHDIGELVEENKAVRLENETLRAQVEDLREENQVLRVQVNSLNARFGGVA